MKKILLLVSLIAVFANPQQFSIKQITTLNADCRNINCGGYIGYSIGSSVYYAFEARKGN